MKLHPRTMPVQGASAAVKMALLDLQAEHDLTDVEMLQVLHDASLGLLKHLLRAERHPGDPGRKADEA